MAFSISVPWLKGDVDGLTRRSELSNRPALRLNPGTNETRLDASRTLVPYQDPPRMSYLERNFDRVTNAQLRAIRPDEEVEGSYLDPTIDSMLAEDLSDYQTAHQLRRMEVSEYLGAVDARLREIELEMREIENRTSNRRLIAQPVRDTDAAKVQEGGA